MTVMRTAVAQLPNVVGDIGGNAKRVAEAMDWAEAESADVLVLPELVLTGYPVSDLVLQREFVAEAEEATAALAQRSGQTVTVLSTVSTVPPRRSWDSMERTVAISAALLTNGENRGFYHKVLLPTHGAYDEGKNIAPGDRPNALWNIGDVVAGVSICEDLWSGDGPPEAQARDGARVILAPNASPYHRTKAEGRRQLAASVARRNGVPLVYVNLVGGQDELMFDGGSLVLDREGALLYRAPSFTEGRAIVDVPVAPPRAVGTQPRTVHMRPLPDRPASEPAPIADPGDELEQVWQALVLGTRDFARKNGFTQAVLGLSGGIDAALTATVASEALGPCNVLGVAMPCRGIPNQELAYAEEVAGNLGIELAVVRIDPALEGLETTLAGAPTSGSAPSAPLEQRMRASVLTAISDRDGHLILATGNKTELSIGASTLYGDMVGGFGPLQDCPKTLVYRLARLRNAKESVVPSRVLEKPTSAHQREEDLPSYDVLDTIIERTIQYSEGVEDLVAKGLDAEVVVEVLRRIDDAEFKRRQAPPGVKISPRAFGADRDMPISNAWRVKRRDDVGAGDPQGPRFHLEPEAAADPDR